jgi:hypothetical protein
VPAAATACLPPPSDHRETIFVTIAEAGDTESRRRIEFRNPEQDPCISFGTRLQGETLSPSFSSTPRPVPLLTSDHRPCSKFPAKHKLQTMDI